MGITQMRKSNDSTLNSSNKDLSFGNFQTIETNQHLKIACAYAYAQEQETYKDVTLINEIIPEEAMIERIQVQRMIKRRKFYDVYDNVYKRSRKVPQMDCISESSIIKRRR